MQKTTVVTAIVLAAMTTFGEQNAKGATYRPFEFEGRMQGPKGHQHFSYVFLFQSKTVVRLDYDSEGQVQRISHGEYSISPTKSIVIFWSCGKNERGQFSSCGRQYCVQVSGDPRVAKGCRQYVTDQTRMRFIDVYLRAQRQVELTRQFRQMASGEHKIGLIRNTLPRRRN